MPTRLRLIWVILRCTPDNGSYVPSEASDNDESSLGDASSDDDSNDDDDDGDKANIVGNQSPPA